MDCRIPTSAAEIRRASYLWLWFLAARKNRIKQSNRIKESMPRGGARPGAGRKKRSETPGAGATAPMPDLKRSAPANSAPSDSTRVNGKFAPGHSGNPSGRPKGERAFLVTQYGEDAAVLHERLDRLAANKKTPAHVKAEILKFKIERHSGKAPQAITGEGGGPVQVVVSSSDARL